MTVTKFLESAHPIRHQLEQVEDDIAITKYLAQSNDVTVTKFLDQAADDIAVTKYMNMSQDPLLLQYLQQAEDDIAVTREGVTLLVDPLSFQYLAGAKVDYSEDLQGAQFVIRNPNASTTCGCGSSFAI